MTYRLSGHVAASDQEPKASESPIRARPRSNLNRTSEGPCCRELRREGHVMVGGGSALRLFGNSTAALLADTTTRAPDAGGPGKPWRPRGGRASSPSGIRHGEHSELRGQLPPRGAQLPALGGDRHGRHVRSRLTGLKALSRRVGAGRSLRRSAYDEARDDRGVLLPRRYRADQGRRGVAST